VVALLDTEDDRFEKELADRRAGTARARPPRSERPEPRGSAPR
jgi:hypothetical protein